MAGQARDRFNARRVQLQHLKRVRGCMSERISIANLSCDPWTAPDFFLPPTAQTTTASSRKYTRKVQVLPIHSIDDYASNLCPRTHNRPWCRVWRLCPHHWACRGYVRPREARSCSWCGFPCIMYDELVSTTCAFEQVAHLFQIQEAFLEYMNIFVRAKCSCGCAG